MKFFGLVFLFKLHFLATIIITINKQIDAKCIMREPCSSAAKKNENPLEKTWFNCKYDGEPQPLKDRHIIEEFKKMCAPLYLSNKNNNDDENIPLCCSDNQIPILKNSLVVAEQIIGSCSSCFHNFRLIWCHLTCAPNQSEFMVPIDLDFKPYQNFTEYQLIYTQKLAAQAKKNSRVKRQANQVQTQDRPNSNTSKAAKAIATPKKTTPTLKSTTKTTSKSTTTITTTTTTTPTTEAKGEDFFSHLNNNLEENGENNEEDEGDEFPDEIHEPIIPENDDKPEKFLYAVRTVNYYIRQEFVQGFIDSCR